MTCVIAAKSAFRYLAAEVAGRTEGEAVQGANSGQREPFLAGLIKTQRGYFETSSPAKINPEHAHKRTAACVLNVPASPKVVSVLEWDMYLRNR